MSPASTGKTTVLLGVGGGIAAFKAAALASQLVQSGHHVRVLMTRSALSFVGRLTFQGLTGRPVAVSSLELTPGGEAAHIQAAREASCLVVAPATADLLARLAGGFADDALTLAALCFQGPRIFCPAMNDRMWNHPLVQQNAATLSSQGWTRLGPAEGPLAEGYEAVGRMVEPPEILAAVRQALAGR